MNRRAACAVLIFLLGVSCSPTKESGEAGTAVVNESQTAPERRTAGAFFSDLIPGAIQEGRIYLQVPLVKDLPQAQRAGDEEQKEREAFFRMAVPKNQWRDLPYESQKEGYVGTVIPDQYLDLRYIAGRSRYAVGQTLKVLTSDGIVPVRIAKFEISYSEGGGQFYFYAIGEPVNGLLKMPSQHVVAATDLPDCNRSCALSTTKPSEDKAQKIRALAVEKLRVTFPEDIPEKERAETLVVYEGHFTRVDGTQYVAFFSRHHKDAMDQGKWATYVANSDFSLISVLGRDDYLNVMPDGVADVNGDGLDEIWSDDVGFEGTAYSLWYLNKTDPISFARIEWEYFGL